MRPDGITWPAREDGLPSFRLEELTAANGISHESAHDALSDVHATIAMAKLIRDKQPRLFDYVLRHRDKQSVLAQLDLTQMKPVLHVSGMFGGQRHNIALIVPLAMHPNNKNEVICYDLSVDPLPLRDVSLDHLQNLLFSRKENLPADAERPGLKSIHLNKCPIIVPAKMADPATAERLGIDGALCRSNLALLRSIRQADVAKFNEKIQNLYAGRKFKEISDPDRMLYSGGFFSAVDRRLMDQLRASSAQDLASTSFPFEDSRLQEMLFRYRARNYRDSLSAEELARWEEYRFGYLTEPEMGASICMEAYQEEIESLLQSDGVTAPQRELLHQLLEYGDSLLG